ncbi:transposable element Tcb2 transposase [Trichonephila clavipes]|nr:transposable element Tcb2 transposase [Trichonephila clavipes]
MQRNSSTVMRVWKQWIIEHRTTGKTGSGRRKVKSAHDDRHLLHMAVNDRTASSRQLTARWSTATGVLLQDPFTANHRWLRLQWAHERRAWQADWHQVVFLDESRFNFCGTMMTAFVLDAMPVNAFFQSALSNNIVA